MRRAFTLIEILLVVAIIVILAFLAVGNVRKSRAKAKLTQVSTELTAISNALTQYVQDKNFQYPPDVDRSVPPGLEKYLAGGVWPASAWPNGVYDWDNWIHPTTGETIYQITYRLCDLDDPIATCADPILFPNFVRHSGIIYCIEGPCIPHKDNITVPAYCINCTPKEMNY